MRVFFGRDAFHVTAELIACYGPKGCERISSYMVRKLAFRVTPESAGRLCFWAGVLAQSNTLQLSDEMGPYLRAQLTPERSKAFEKLERRSRPQVVPSATVPANTIG